MKFKALILSLCLLLYIAELVALPVSINNTPVKGMCCSGKMNKTAQHPCKKPQKDCNASNCCVNCPLCYVVTMPAHTAPGKSFSAVKKEYPAFQFNYLFLYYSTAWKPPNA